MVRIVACARRFLAVLALAGLAQMSGTSLVSAAENCEQYQSPFQYNECLARQAPARRSAPRAPSAPAGRTLKRLFPLAAETQARAPRAALAWPSSATAVVACAR